MKSNNYILTGCDTDSIMFCKQDQTSFTEEEVEDILNKLNEITPERIIWEDDGYFPAVLVIKTKNYALYDGKSVTIKGSGLKATQKEPALREMLHRMIHSLLEITDEDLQEIYYEYVKEAANVKDITRWGAKKSVTSAVQKPTRTNEQKVKDAIEGEGLQIGEKFYVFFRSDNSLALTKYFDGDYHEDKFLQKIYDTAKVLKTVVDVDTLFPNFKLKKNKKELDKLTGKVVRYERKGLKEEE